MMKLSRSVGTLLLALLLAVALASCDDDGQKNDGTAGGPENSAAPAADGDEQDAADPLSHDDALAAGLAGDESIVCTYTFDDEELAGRRMLDPSAWLSPVADIYLDGTTIYWDIPEEGDRRSHLLGVGDELYVWDEPGEATGAVSPNLDSDVAALTDRLSTHTSECRVYSGPSSIFEVPDGITFSSFPGT